MNNLQEKTDEEDGDVDSLDLTPASRGGSSKLFYIFIYFKDALLVARVLMLRVPDLACQMRRHSRLQLTMDSVVHTDKRS